MGVNITFKLVEDNVENYVGDIDYLESIKFCDFRETLYPWNISKPQSREIKYPPNYIHADFEIFFFLILDHSMKLISISDISTYSNEIRVSVTYLITITLINNK